MIDIIGVFFASLPYLILVGGTIGLIAYEGWKQSHKKQSNADETTKET